MIVIHGEIQDKLDNLLPGKHVQSAHCTVYMNTINRVISREDKYNNSHNSQVIIKTRSSQLLLIAVKTKRRKVNEQLKQLG